MPAKIGGGSRVGRKGRGEAPGTGEGVCWPSPACAPETGKAVLYSSVRNTADTQGSSRGVRTGDTACWGHRVLGTPRVDCAVKDSNLQRPCCPWREAVPAAGNAGKDGAGSSESLSDLNFGKGEVRVGGGDVRCPAAAVSGAVSDKEES